MEFGFCLFAFYVTENHRLVQMVLAREGSDMGTIRQIASFITYRRDSCHTHCSSISYTLYTSIYQFNKTSRSFVFKL
jgi:hypothetical protein